MIKLKHVMVAPLLAMLAVMAPAGCSMEAGGTGAPESDEATSATESPDESSATESSELAASYKWRYTTADTCGEWCGDCGCEPTKRCTQRVPTNQPCSKRGDVCAKVAGNEVNIVYYTCK